MGTSLAAKFVRLGHEVAIANSRGPASLKYLASNFGAAAATVEEVVKGRDVVVVSIHEKNIESLPKGLFKGARDGTVVIDTGNYYPNLRGGAIPALDEDGIDSLWVQGQLGVPVVKAFNAIMATSLKDKGRPAGTKGRIALLLSGDDARAKQVVGRLVDGLGFDPFDIGDIARSWKQQPGSPVYGRDITAEEVRKRLDVMETRGYSLADVIAQRKADEIQMAADYPSYLEGLQRPYPADGTIV